MENAAGCEIVRNAIRIPSISTMLLSFDPWALDTSRRLLLRDGNAAPLSPKAFDLLSLLAEHHERALSKTELHQQLWPKTFVSDGSLTILIAEIRDAARETMRNGHGSCERSSASAMRSARQSSTVRVRRSGRSIAAQPG